MSIQEAIYNDDIRLLKKIVKGDNLDTRIDGNTPLIIAVATKNINAVKLLIKMGADLNLKNRDKETALVVALKSGVEYNKIAKLLIRAGCDINIVDPIGGTSPMNIATINDNVSMVKVLFDQYDILTDREQTGLMIATIYKSLDCLKFFIKMKVDLDDVDEDGMTALMYACIGNNLVGVKALVRAGCDPYAVDNSNRTAMDIAKKWKRDMIYKYLSYL